MIDSLSWDEVQHWATLLQHLPVAVIATDETGVVELWTEGATQLFGWSAAEAIGRPVTDLTVGPSEQRVADDIIRRVMALNVWEGEFTARRRDGTSVDIHVIDAPILDEHGTLAGIVGVSIDVSLSRSDLQRTLHEVRTYADVTAAALDADRARISRELHDEAGQSLLCIRLQMELIEQGLPPAAEESRVQLSEARSLTERTILEMRRLISALSPAVLEQLGLGAALRQLISRFRRLYPCRVKLQVPRLREVPHQLEIISYRLVQECLNNIGKHSAAKNVNISVSSTDGRLRLNVEDDGVGFDVGTAFNKRESFGLAGMRERVALLSGRFHVESRPKGRRTGTKIWVELPIPS